MTQIPVEKQYKLKPHHLAMMAIGGSIGTGLFVTSGHMVEVAGPAGALLAFLASGLMVYALMESLGELASKFPSHSSFCAYGQRFIHPSIGFALGWNYWLNWTITLAVELATLQQLFRFWMPEVGLWACALPAFGVILFLNGCSAQGFGEAEYWISGLKVVTIGAFLVVGSAQLLWRLFHAGVAQTLIAWSPATCWGQGWGGWTEAAMLAAFAFQGTEMLAVAAGEVQNPERSVPKAVASIFWRIFAFTLGTNFLVSTLGYSGQGGREDCLVSPFTQLFASGIGAPAAGLMNVVLISAVFSSANSGFYAASRMLKGLAEQGMAPRKLGEVNKRGVPLYALGLTLWPALLCLLGCWMPNANLFFALVQASTMSGLIAWMGIAASHYRFRQACLKQNVQIRRGMKAKLHPWGALLSFFFCSFLCLASGGALWQGASSTRELWGHALALYGPWIFFIFSFIFHRWRSKSGWAPLKSIPL